MGCIVNCKNWKTSYPEDDSSSSVCEDEFESESNKDETQISEKYKLYRTFYETWVKEFPHEWKEEPVSNTTCSYRYKSCALGCGSNTLEIGCKEKATIERHFGEVDLDLNRKCVNWEINLW